jgi:hypothetical protein
VAHGVLGFTLGVLCTFACAHRPPPSPPPAPEPLFAPIALDPFLNGSLDRPWLPPSHLSGSGGNDLSDLPTSPTELAEIPFEPRGLIQLAGRSVKAWGGAFPGAVTGIPVGRRAIRLHFLHAVHGQASERTPVAAFTLRYTDGSTERLSILYGVHVRDWWFWPEEQRRNDQTEIAWVGECAAAKRFGLSVRLYKTTWNNPRPRTPIATLDYTSDGASASPFLVALTAERSAP